MALRVTQVPFRSGRIVKAALSLAVLVILGLAPGFDAGRAAETGTQGITGNPNCDPPVINGITPKNWSCPTSNQQVTGSGTATPSPASSPYYCRPVRLDDLDDAVMRGIGTMRDMARVVFQNYQTRRPILIARIANITNAVGYTGNTYLVAMSGTELLRPEQATRLDESWNLLNGQVDDYTASVVAALNELGVPPQAPILLVGHSLGGMVGQMLPSNRALQFEQRWPRVRVITLGSPIMNPSELARIGAQVRRFSIIGDPVVVQLPHLFPAVLPPAPLTDSPEMTYVDNGGDLVDLHNTYPNSRKLDTFDALGEPVGAGVGRSLILDPSFIFRCHSVIGTASGDIAGLSLVPTGVNVGADPATLLHGGRISASDLAAIIPIGTPNTWTPGDRIVRGFKFEWRVGTTRYRAHGHERDPNQPPGTNAGDGWTVRIRIDNRWLLENGNTSPNSTLYANESHIPFDP